MSILDTAGIKFQKQIGLGKIKYVFIQKVLGIALPIYVLTYNSRYPTINMGSARVKKLKSSGIFRLKKFVTGVERKQIRLTPPILLHLSSVNLVSGSLIFFRDVAGEMLMKRKMIEIAISDKGKLKFIENEYEEDNDE